MKLVDALKAGAGGGEGVTQEELNSRVALAEMKLREAGWHVEGVMDWGWFFSDPRLHESRPTRGHQ